MKLNLFFLTAAIFFFSSSASAQMLGMNLSMFQAQGEFNKNMDTDPVGLSFTYAHDIGEGPVSLGGELGVAMYSSQEYEALDNNGKYINVYEEDCFYSFHGHVQYMLVDHTLYNIYGEGRIGFTTFFSEQNATDEGVEYDDSFKFHGTAFNVGMGGGMRVNLSRIFYGEATTYDQIWLDGAISTNNGTRTTYRNAGEDTRLLTDANFRSLTDYTHLRVGLAFKFN